MKDESLRSALAELVRLKNAGLLGVDHGGPEYGADCPICNAWIAARAALQQVPDALQDYLDASQQLTAAEQRQDVLDARRFRFWFSPLPRTLDINEYLRGVREGWNIDQWRAHVDEQMLSVEQQDQ